MQSKCNPEIHFVLQHVSSAPNGVEEGGVINAAKCGPQTAGALGRITRCEIETNSQRRARAVVALTT